MHKRPAPSSATLVLPRVDPAPVVPTAAGAPSVDLQLGPEAVGRLRALASELAGTSVAAAVAAGLAELARRYLRLQAPTLALRVRARAESGWRSVELAMDRGEPLADGIRRVGERLSQAAAPVDGGAGAVLRLTLDEVASEVGAALDDAWVHLALVPRDDGGLSGRLAFQADQVDGELAACLARGLPTLLERAVASPGAPLPALEVLEEAALQQLAGWNGGSVDLGGSAQLHVRFEAQADRTPDAVALVQGDAQLTYRQLDQRANQLAHWMLGQGVRPGAVVALFMERSVETIVGLLAALKTGATYIPLDIGHPPQRLGDLLEDAQPQRVLTRRSLAARLPGTQTLCLLEEEAEARASLPTTRPRVEVSPTAAAYCLFTSGSTGKPKGVLVSHLAVSNLLAAVQQSFPLSAEDVVLQHSSMGFDASVWEIYHPLTLGAKLVLGAQDANKDVGQIRRLLEEHQVTQVVLVPSVLEVLVGEQSLRSLPALKRMHVGGEALRRSLVEKVLAQSPHTEVVNVYGPTEATVYATMFSTRLDPRGATTFFSIGRAVGNCRLHVLDERLRPVPVGVPGELFIAGPQLATGYLQRPALTAERFVPNPAGPAGERMYRTGDLVKWRADGCLDFIGRVDFQVKLRGQRVELGEIEAALLEHPRVREAVVVVQGAEASARLVAYTSLSAEVTPEALTQHLAQRLPDYMVPRAWVTLPELPKGDSGKIDRKALPPHVDEARSGEPPTTPTERLLAGLWQELFGVGQVFRGDDFFHLGGNSLLAMRLASRAGEVLGRAVSYREVFAAPRLESLAAQLDATSQAEAPLAERTLDGPLPASSNQRQLWLMEQLEPGQSAYNVPLVVAIDGALDAAVLQRALDWVVARHEPLRTRLVTREGRPFQEVAPPAPVPLRRGQVDLAGFAKRLVELLEQPFDLSRGPTVRATLLELGEQQHRLVVVVHHAFIDGWSLPVFLEELSGAYAAFRAGASPAAAPLELRYADYTAWQERWLKTDAARRQLDFWKSKLAGMPPVLNLPLDRPRPVVISSRGAVTRFELPAPVGRRVEQLAHEEGTTPFTLLLCVFQAVLARWARTPEVPVGVPFAERERPELQRLIGYFVNSVVFRGDLSGAPSLRELLGRGRAWAQEAHANAAVPFDRVVEHLNPERSTAYTPLFQVQFVFETEDRQVVGEAPSFRLEPLTEWRSAKFDLTLIVRVQRSGAVRCLLEHRAELFDRQTVERLGQCFEVLLTGALERPDTPLAQLPLLSDEVDAFLARAGQGPVHEVPVGSVHARIQAQARQTPRALAVDDGETQLSFAQLEARANQLAHHLRGLGVGPEVRVAVCLERSAEAVVALLATLKAGGAYVPLDPAYPRDRLDFIAQDARCEVLVTRSALQPLLAHPPERQVVLDRKDAQWAALSEAPPAEWTRPHHLAYVLYTSGSTGRPKGVAIEHHHVAQYLEHCQREYPFGLGHGAPVQSSLAFDLTVTSLWAPLAAGKAAVMVRAENAAVGLAEAVAPRPGFGVIKLTPTHLRMLGEQLSPQLAARCTASFVVGGEALTGEDIAFWRKHAPKTRIINEYGPTETTVGCCTYEVSATDATVGALPIGRPIANATLYVLDEALLRVPVGVAGELYIGGAGVGRGYLNRPDLTAERFVPNPWGPPGARMYRTGDLARLLPNGHFDFLGRIDSQVKLRGLRIELGEIESALLRHPAVREAVVVLAGAGRGDRLVAHIVPQGALPEAADLAADLARLLPDYMVPREYQLHETIPLSANGKVDRQALERSAPQAAARVVEPPDSPTEVCLAESWAQLLGQPSISRRDHFFELGGHSLLAMQFIAAVRERLGRTLSLREVFAHPRLHDLAAHLDATAVRVEGIPRRPSRGPARASANQEQLWLIDQYEPGKSTYNVPLVVRLDGPLNLRALRAALDYLWARHEALRTHFEAIDGEPYQVVSPARAAGLQAREVSEAALPQSLNALCEQPFDLSRGPLTRVQLWRLGPARHVLGLVFHHSVMDGWSVGILFEELHQAYEAFDAGAAAPDFPPVRVQGADFAQWQAGWLKSDEAQRQLEFWRRRLDGAPQLMELPTDHPRPKTLSSAGGVVDVQLEPALFAQVQALAASSGTTAFAALLTVFQALLARYCRQHDVVVGTPFSGRARVELHRTVGYYVNPLVVRGDFGADPSFAEAAKAVGRSVGDALANADLPFETLVKFLRPDRALGGTPLFNVMFVFNEEELATARAAGVTFSAEPSTRSGTAKFDLTLTLTRTRDGGMTGNIEYRSDLFERQTAVRMAGHFVALLQRVAAAPTAPLSTLDLMTPEEHRQLVAWNQHPLEVPHDVCVHQLFERQVDATPDAPAVTQGTTTLTYRQLDERANQLAHWMQAGGVSTDSLVALCFDRSIEMVVAYLATLKAGAAYVPLDPSYPKERLGQMLEDCRSRVLLTQQHLLEVLPPTDTVVLSLDAQWAEVAAQPSSRPRNRAHPLSGAYVIFTSGSTGRPKGTLLHHHALVNYLVWVQSVLPVGPGDRVLQKTSFSFDVSVSELNRPLLNGAELVLGGKDAHRDPAEILRVMREYAITDLHIVPSLAQFLIEEPGFENCTALQRVLFGGEALPAELARKFQAKSRAKLQNNYGPSECTIDVAFFPIPEGYRHHAVPIGFPLGNTQHHVLDERLAPLPVGIPGELYVGGPQVGRGYLHRPELTADRFIPDPFGPPGSRLYRTGDLVKRYPTGEVEFLGRIDSQVKLRGLRIELGEIEFVLLQQPAVKEAAVMVHGDGPSARLVGYVGHGDAPAPAPEALMAALKEKLPQFMVPQAWVVQPSLPHTSSAKLNRRALLALPVVSLSAAAGEDPRCDSPGAEQVMALWQELLKVERVRPDDNFFDLGGHSLLAARFLSVLRKRRGHVLDLRTFFEAPTARQLGALLDAAGTASAPEARSVLAPPPEEAGQISLFEERMVRYGEDGHAWLTSWPLHLNGPLHLPALERALLEIRRQQAVLRGSYRAVGGRVLKTVEPAAPTPLPVVRAQGDTPEARRDDVRGRIVRAEQQRADEVVAAWPNVTNAQLFSLTLYELAPTEHVLHVLTHHMFTDHASAGIFQAALEEEYANALAGRPPGSPPEVSYDEVGRLNRAFVRGDEGQRQLAHWREHLKDAPPSSLHVPTDKPRAKVDEVRRTRPLAWFPGVRAEVPLDPALLEKLQSVARAQGITPGVFVTAAFCALLSRWSGQREANFFAPQDSRKESGSERVMGYLSNPLVMRVPTHHATFRDLLLGTRDALLLAYSNGEVAVLPTVFERANALFYTNFNFMMSAAQPAQPAQPGAAEAAKRLSVSWFKTPSFDTTMTPFDLYVAFQVTPEAGACHVLLNAELFEQRTTERLAENLRKLLGHFLDSPEAPLDSCVLTF